MDWKLSWAAILLLSLGGYSGVDGFIGVEWGRFSTQSLVPSMVVDLLLQNGVNEIRLSSPSPNVMEALYASPLGVTVALQNDFILRDKYTNNLKTINDWVKELIVKPVKNGVDIKQLVEHLTNSHHPFQIGFVPWTHEQSNPTLVVLEEPLTLYRTPVWNLTDVFNATVMSLKSNGLNHIRTTTAHFTDVLKNVSKPSESDFRDDIKDTMVNSLKLMENTNNSFFMYNLWPIFSARVNDWPIEFAFVDNKSNFTIVDGKYTYRNAFEFLFDALVIALEKAGHPDMEIVIGEIGWPTDGGKHATPENAERFYRGLLRHIKEKKGTPRRPNQNIDVFLATLTDENRLVLSMGPIQRHRGIYNIDGTPKFKIDFTGNGRDIWPTTAKGTVKMPERWCIFNENTSNKTKVDEQREFACKQCDCSALTPDSSCSDLSYSKNVSYAFNMYFQTMNQDIEKDNVCDFDGLGVLTPDDPSVGDCVFPVEILTAEKVDGGTQMPFSHVGYSDSSGHQLKSYTAQMLPIFFALLYLKKQFG